MTSNPQVLNEIESKATFSIQQLQFVRAQLASQTREKRMLQLAQTELAALPAETPVYEGVGKMCVARPFLGGGGGGPMD